MMGGVAMGESNADVISPPLAKLGYMRVQMPVPMSHPR